jgi:hypothetical protein
MWKSGATPLVLKKIIKIIGVMLGRDDEATLLEIYRTPHALKVGFPAHRQHASSFRFIHPTTLRPFHCQPSAHIHRCICICCSHYEDHAYWAARGSVECSASSEFQLEASAVTKGIARLHTHQAQFSSASKLLINLGAARFIRY